VTGSCDTSRSPGGRLRRPGATPAAQSPCADVAGVASLGVLQVSTDPRTDVAQCLRATPTAESTDDDGRRWLINLSETPGRAGPAGESRGAPEDEEGAPGERALLALGKGEGEGPGVSLRQTLNNEGSQFYACNELQGASAGPH